MSDRISEPERPIPVPAASPPTVASPEVAAPARRPGTGRFRSPVDAVVQRARRDPGSLTRAEVVQLQRSIGNAAVGRLLAGAGAAPNRTGLPDGLKRGVEAASGLPMDDVRVHYNSSKPAEVDAHAYARGTEIHLAPGQERHLPHEAWHVVQQMQGRVKATATIGTYAINDDERLEREADLKGNSARGAHDGFDFDLSALVDETSGSLQPAISTFDGAVIQAVFAVGVPVNRVPQTGQRVVGRIDIGERPNTQFGSKQEDHVLAWTLICEHLKSNFEGRTLQDASAYLVQIVGDQATIYGNEEMSNLATTLGYMCQKASDDLDRQQIIQYGMKEFLELYNADENVTMKRVGPADKTEGARVKKAKNAIEDMLKNDSDDVDAFVVHFMNTVQVPDWKSEAQITDVIAILATQLITYTERGKIRDRKHQILVRLVRRFFEEYDHVSINLQTSIYKKVKSRLTEFMD